MGGTGATTASGALTNLGVADYIVGQGTTNGWIWRKWNSGIGECWIRNSYSVRFNNAWGSLYETASFPSVNYPFSFKELPFEFAAPSNPTLGSWIESTGGAGQTASKTNQYQLIRPAKDATAVTQAINIYVVGKWK